MLTKIPPQWRLAVYQLVKLVSAVALGAGVVSEQQAETIGAALITLLLGTLAAANTPSFQGAKPELPQVRGAETPREDGSPIIAEGRVTRAPQADPLAAVRSAIDKALADGQAQTRRVTDELGRVLRVQITPEAR